MSYESIGWSSEKEPVVINDVTKSDLLQYPEDAKKEGISAIINIPIKFRGNIIGALRLYHHDVWEISDRDVDSLNKIAEIFGVALMHTRVENALQSINDTVKDVHAIWLNP
jgi:transcriptional regulator with GAF, ATPase, and Fis domain